MPGAAQHLRWGWWGTGGGLARSLLVLEGLCCASSSFCLFFIISFFLKMCFFYLFFHFSAGTGHGFYNPAGTSYAALMPEQVLTLNTAFSLPSLFPELSIPLPTWPGGKGPSMKASSA